MKGTEEITGDDRNIQTLVRCAYKCLVCGDVIESDGQLVYCSCGALGLDGKAGPAYVPYRIIGKEHLRQSYCIWRLGNGQILKDYD